MAICFDKIFTKNEQIDLYLASVRFERGVYGVMEAMHFFWNHIVAKPSKAESFFLIERVSNINSKILVHKIVQTARYAKTLGMFTDADLDELLMLYRDATTSGKIKDLDGGMALLSNFFHH
ncbi:hypothetical protein GMLC_22650 [Geomonas limicola]|uniref:Uncharacterized protein n=1 Tax=Geomonas limicola TaxID=2740186 RepID=A0A6V8N7X9_9BACT|nr:hypothetical protein GMLC_22650 [Geomonas limicola]